MRSAAILFLLAFAACPADAPDDLLLARLREKMRADIGRAPRYTCLETISRAQYRPHYGSRPAGCNALIEAQEHLVARGAPLWRDRIRVEVAVGERAEMFSWPGAGKFETSKLDDLVSNGSSGSGEFSTFLANVFGSAAEQFRYLGDPETSLGRLAAFSFVVPVQKSHYQYKTYEGEARIVGYGGTIYADRAQTELRRLVIDAKEFNSPAVCRVTDTMDYTRLKTASGDFLLPSVGVMDALFASGDETVNETRYSDCREFAGESVIRFDDAEPGSPSETARAALRAIPRGTHIQLRIDPPVNAATAAAGDPIIGVVEHTVRDKGQAVVLATDRLHGRLLRLEQTLIPPRWTLAIRFDAIERNGAEQPISLRPLDDGDRTVGRVPRLGRPLVPPPQVPPRPEGAGVFVLDGAELVLGGKFHTEWQTK